MKRVVLGAVLFSMMGWAQERPQLVGLSHIAVRVHDLDAARKFYGGLLGYQEAFTVRKDHTAVVQGGLPQSQVSAVFFKVNNRQFIVVMPESTPTEPRFVDYAIETPDAEAMRLYMRSLGYQVPDAVRKNATNDLSFSGKDPEGTAFEIVQYTPASLSIQTVGRFMNDDRVSLRILHVGLQTTKKETADFYLKAFSLREFWRADPTMVAGHAPGQAPPPAKKKALPQNGPLMASLSNLKLPESDDYLEWSLSHPNPNAPAGGNAGKKGGRGPASPALPGSNPGGHIALVVPDMARAVAFIKSKPAWKDYARADQTEAHVGINHKWQGNLYDADGTRTECMEADTADGFPSPMSKAPYYQ